MNTYTKKELNKILENHLHWLKKDCDGWEDMRANLSNADLSTVKLSNVDLSYAKLYCADLRNADLSNANLYEAKLYCADLRNADLRNADLSNADLYEAKLSCVKNLYHPLACPSDGDFIGWKKANASFFKHEHVLVKLQILEDSKRLSATSRKCRCDKAKVLDITSLDGNVHYTRAYSHYDKEFEYIVGEVVSVDNFEENRWIECSPGIHFFTNKQDAIDY